MYVIHTATAILPDPRILKLLRFKPAGARPSAPSLNHKTVRCDQTMAADARCNIRPVNPSIPRARSLLASRNNFGSFLIRTNDPSERSPKAGCWQELDVSQGQPSMGPVKELELTSPSWTPETCYRRPAVISALRAARSRPCHVGCKAGCSVKEGQESYRFGLCETSPARGKTSASVGGENEMMEACRAASICSSARQEAPW